MPVEERELEEAWLCPKCNELYMPDDDYTAYYCLPCSGLEHIDPEAFGPYVPTEQERRRLQPCTKVRTADSGESIYIPGEDNEE